jgi:hypothetical protein
MNPESKRYTANVGTRTVTFETGKLAGQAGGAVTVGINDAIVFAAATMEARHRLLSVEYEERLYAAAIGSFRAGKHQQTPYSWHRSPFAPFVPTWHAERSAGGNVLPVR